VRQSANKDQAPERRGLLYRLQLQPMMSGRRLRRAALSRPFGMP